MIPSALLVARHWLISLPEVGSIQVGQSLQTPYTSWTEDLYITVSFIDTEADEYVPLRSAVVQVDVWGRPITTQRGQTVPINRCVSVAESIADLTYGFVPVIVDVAGVEYFNVDLKDVMVRPVRGPRPIRERQPSGSQVAIGRASMDLQFTYMPIYE